MRSMLIAALVLAPAWCVAQPPEPLSDDADLNRALESVRLVHHRGIADVPGHARSLGDGAHWASSDGQHLYVHGFDEQLWHVELTGGERLPSGTRLLPIIELSTVRFASLPDEDYALLVPGRDRVFIFDVDRVAWSLPIEAVGSARNAFERTAVVRAMRACPRSHDRCALIGRPEGVTAAVDPLAPNHGWSLGEVPPVEVPPGLTYTRSELPTSLEDARIVVDTASVPAEHPTRIERVFLRYRGRTNHAFDALWVGSGRPLEPRYAAVALGGRIYVHDHEDQVSAHDRRTGRRMGAPRRASLEPYEDICLAGDDGFRLVPVLDRRRVAFAMVTIAGEAYLFERPGGDSVRRALSLDARSGELWNISFLERRGRTLQPRIVVRR